MFRRFFLVSMLALSSLAQAGILEDYVRKEDKAFGYELRKENVSLGARVLMVRLTSQEWRGHKWQHWLAVFVPPVVDSHKKCILLIEGGSNKDEAPNPQGQEAMMLGMTAVNLRVPVAIVLQVPSQPLYGDLYEDDLIAHTFDKYLNGGEDDWPLLLPMVKSATSAMTAIQRLAKEGKLKTAGGALFPIESFIVGGASKRGWTTWLTGAVDQRVCAMAPSVIDVLNMDAQMRQQKKTYGQFSHMIEPYTSRKIMRRLESPRGELLRKVVDPYEYRDRLSHPKLLLLGTNDPYWTADAAQLYYPELKGPKAMYYLPNSGHGLGLGVLPTLNGFFASVLENKPFPQLSFENGEAGLKVQWDRDGTPSLWSAITKNRDFRKSKWAVEALEGKRTVNVALKEPDAGWEGSFVTVTFPGIRESDPPFSLSTPITVLPKKFPHE